MDVLTSATQPLSIYPVGRKPNVPEANLVIDPNEAAMAQTIGSS